MDDRIGLIQSLRWRKDTVDQRIQLNWWYVGIWAKKPKGVVVGWFWKNTWMRLTVHLSSVILSWRLFFRKQWLNTPRWIKRVIILKPGEWVIMSARTSPANRQASTRLCTEWGSLVEAETTRQVDHQRFFFSHFLPELEVEMTPFKPRKPLDFLNCSRRERI